MEAVLLGLDESVCTRQGLLWTLTSTALRRLRVHARNLPAPQLLLHTHGCVFRPLYQVGCTSCANFTRMCTSRCENMKLLQLENGIRFENQTASPLAVSPLKI